MQLSLEREEAERAELRRFILGQSDNKQARNLNKDPDQPSSSSHGNFTRFQRP